MHGAYIYYRDINSASLKKTGIDNKVADQVKAFNDNGLNCDFIYCKQPESFAGKALSVIPLFPDGIAWPDVRSMKHLDYLYIRRARYISSGLVSFLKKLKRVNPTCTVFFELPDYPYDDEMKIPLLYTCFIKDCFNRKRLAGLVDYFVVIGNEALGAVFGIPAICVPNGIDIGRVPLRTPQLDSNAIDILFAAYTVNGDQRYATDRILQGMSEYYKNGGTRCIRLHMAVGGTGIKQIKQEIKKYGMSNHVVFYGALASEELAKVADKCGIGMATLGFHRIGIDVSSAIKTRDYLARGLPFFYAGEIDLFIRKDVNFCLKCPADNSPIDIDALIDFYDSLYSEHAPGEIARIVRQYAIEHVSMDATLSPVFNAIRNVETQKYRIENNV